MIRSCGRDRFVGRGVAVLPDWLVREVAGNVPVPTLRIGKAGRRKSINVGLRRSDIGTVYLTGSWISPT